MDVELQVIQHLARDAQKTIPLVDEYCRDYTDIFPEVNGFKQCKQELGWTDYRFTKFEQIERWWEIIFSAYLMVSLRTQPLAEIHQLSQLTAIQKTAINELLPSQWNSERAGKNSLNNILLLMIPLISLWLISPWLEVFPNHSLLMGFHRLNQSVAQLYHHFSSA